MPQTENFQAYSLPFDLKITKKIRAGVPAPSIVFNYINDVSETTGRNVIVYYSSFPNESYGMDSSVNERDISGFMRVMTGLDRSKGLDLIIQTPGGDPLAAEGIVEYLHAEFKGDIRLIVPYCAYSAGTLIACATKTVILGNHSCLGPVDPQILSYACLNILKDFDEARKDITENPNALGYWKLRLAGYPAGIYRICEDGVNLGNELLDRWLHKYMFAGETGPEVDEKIDRIYHKLNSNNHNHGRHFGYAFCKELGLKVEQLEENPALYQNVMLLHHGLEHFIAENNAAKLIMNQHGMIHAVTVSRREEADEE